MNKHHNILSMLGLALRGGRLAVGEEPVEAVARARDARILFLASDATDNTQRRAKHFADAGQCLFLQLPFTKAEVGQAVGRTSAAIVAVTDVGLAAAIVHRLADIDPAQYSIAAERLDLKAKRAAERRAEQLAHEKNVRTGKYKPKKKPVSQTEETPREMTNAPTGKQDTPARRTSSTRKSGSLSRSSRSSKENRPKPRANTNAYANSRPVKKGKGSFRDKRKG